ncbi:unnamed protein product [Oikopleura dioica]|uniref:Lipocalin/cytosolic fatty-acid binding domain-containing protein n=1 Tax=Oikopleura dioica TaxID=34765 RepID=E4XYJ4_OIKDI|nr:unnamed protein product [Oikopleura dioica]CBY35497.1 unnamed protein product [Oikopleura dioica]
MKFLLSILALTNAQLITWGGKCPTIPLIKDLDAQAYSGAWFEQARVPDKNQGDDKCVSPIYEVKDERNILVNNTHVIAYTDGDHHGNELQCLSGNAYILDESFPNKLLVTFDFGKQSFNYRNERANYWIMETNYDEYAIVMSCQNLGEFIVEYGWVMAREQNLRTTKPARYNEIYEKARGFSKVWDRSEIFITPQTDCEYDRVTVYPE